MWYVLPSFWTKVEAYAYVGIGIRKDPESDVIWIIRVDYDPNKGLHFNARKPDDHKSKLAARWGTQSADPQAEFKDILKLLEGLDGQQIWKRWYPSP